ncbi:hypothetical protein PR048_002325 [Dryococelus australis]|uniref:Uncharacterized protein n=1 Tax=Dryococelus australis TaxID=614101 RepID=A0ABQ9ILB3_9NEOP|nr:hypothetical protein PR048_002325 [Dryococelus australis]
MSTEKNRKARISEAGNPLTKGIIQRFYNVRKSRRDPAGNRARFALVGGDRSSHSATAAPDREGAARKLQRNQECRNEERISPKFSRKRTYMCPLCILLRPRQATYLKLARDTPQAEATNDSIQGEATNSEMATKRGLPAPRTWNNVGCTVNRRSRDVKPPLATDSVMSFQRIIEVITEQRRNTKAGETGDPQWKPGDQLHDSHMRKSGSDPAGNRTRFALTATPPWPLIVVVGSDLGDGCQGAKTATSDAMP